MPCPHFSISIVQRSKGQSAVAAAAYQSGQRLQSEYDHKTKYYRNKKEVIFSTVLVPKHAPRELMDRDTLWNSIERAESRCDAQLARRIVVALPKELTHFHNVLLIQQFCTEQFVDKGMIADIAVHDKGDGNPHAHILLTMRPVAENGRWLPKCRMVYDLDEHGQKQKTANGNWKCHKEQTVDWDDRGNASVWRNEWEQLVNRYYEKLGHTERVSLHSFADRQMDELPTVHMGPAASRMEKRGVRTHVGNLNREITEYNSARRQLNRKLRVVSDRLTELNALREDAALMAFPYDKQRDLIDLMWAYYDIRADERKSWSRYAQRKADIADLQTKAADINWLFRNNIHNIDDFNARFDALQKSVRAANASIDEMEDKRRHMETLHKHLTNRNKYRQVYEQYCGKLFTSAKERFGEKHREELDLYRTAVRYFKVHPDESGTDVKSLSAEHKKLKETIAAEQEKLPELKAALDTFGRISYYLTQAFRPAPTDDQPDGREDRIRKDAAISIHASIKERPTAAPRKKHRSEPDR